MNIGIVGSGNMGRALGARFAQLGHRVLFGARNVTRARNAANEAAHDSRAGTLDEAARFGDVLVWTARESDPSQVLGDPSLLDGKVVVDLNNRDYAAEASQGITFGEAIAERLQKAAPKAHVVKAFNTIAMESFAIDPSTLRAAGAQTFIAGDDADAKAVVAALAGELGFATADAGAGAPAVRAVEALGDVIRLLMMHAGHGGQAHLVLATLPAPERGMIGARQDSSYR